MIWLWLRNLLVLLGHLVWPARGSFYRRKRLDPQMVCPACGNRGDGHLAQWLCKLVKMPDHGSRLVFARLVANGAQQGATPVCPKCQGKAMIPTPEGLRCEKCGKQFGNEINQTLAVVRHECGVCGFMHYEEPVSVPKRPAV